MRSYKILLVNDDGIDSDALKLLGDALFDLGHLVVIVAPKYEMSSCGHSVTMRDSFEVLKNNNYKYDAYSVAGTPVDCVKFAVSNIIEPDLIISGINNGSNTGMDVFYSGTINAVIEGAMIGYFGIALSLPRDYQKNTIDFIKWFTNNLSKLIEYKDKTCLLNINYPKEYNGKAVFVPLSNKYFVDNYQKVEEDKYIIECCPAIADMSKNSDYVMLKQGYITITPIKIDITDYDALEGHTL